MDEVIYTKGPKRIKKGPSLNEEKNEIGQIIADAVVGALVGGILVIAFALSYRWGYHIGEYFDSRKVTWNLQLVNAENTVPDNYKVDLVVLRNGQSVDRRIYEDLQEMMDDARANGLSPLICSSYRSHEEQMGLFNAEISKYMAQGYSEEEAREKAAQWVAIPGTSEHELGLAVDIVSMDHQMLDASQEQTPEQQWLIANSYKYGFILRYPSDKSELTGISYEPWHYRYVGKEVAQAITEQDLCLEEYLQY